MNTQQNPAMPLQESKRQFTRTTRPEPKNNTQKRSKISSTDTKGDTRSDAARLTFNKTKITQERSGMLSEKARTYDKQQDSKKRTNEDEIPFKETQMNLKDTRKHTKKESRKMSRGIKKEHEVNRINSQILTDSNDITRKTRKTDDDATTSHFNRDLSNSSRSNSSEARTQTRVSPRHTSTPTPKRPTNTSPKPLQAYIHHQSPSPNIHPKLTLTQPVTNPKRKPTSSSIPPWILRLSFAIVKSMKRSQMGAEAAR